MKHTVYGRAALQRQVFGVMSVVPFGATRERKAFENRTGLSLQHHMDACHSGEEKADCPACKELRSRIQ